jgi:phage replication O-like protein O
MGAVRPSAEQERHPVPSGGILSPLPGVCGRVQPPLSFPRRRITLKQPNHTQIPNEFLDEKMKDLSGSAVKVFLVVCRKTIGWHKETDAIAVSQIMDMTGLGEDATKRAIFELETSSMIKVDRVGGGRGKGNLYTVAFEERGVISPPVSDEKGDQNTLPLDDKGGLFHPPTKERDSKKVEKKEPAPSKLITDHFWMRYAERCQGEKPVWKAQYSDVTKKIIATGAKVPVVLQCIDSYFRDRWYFTKGNTFDYAQFGQHWNEIRSHLGAQWKARAPEEKKEPRSMLDLVRNKERGIV